MPNAPYEISSRFLVLLVVVDFGELRIDDVLLLAARSTGVGRPAARCSFLLLLVHGLAELHRGLGQRIGLGGNRLGVVALQVFLEIGHRILDGAALALAHLGAVLGERLLRRMDQRLGVVLGLDLSLALLVLLGMGFSILHHALDVGLGQSAGGLDPDLLLLAGALVLGMDVHDAVCV